MISLEANSSSVCVIHSCQKNCNHMWSKTHDTEVMKKVKSKHLKPENIQCGCIDINPEVLGGLSKSARGKDIKLRVEQAEIAQTTILATKIAESCMKNDLNKKQLLDWAMDNIQLLLSVNTRLNQFRQDAMKPTMQPQFQSSRRVLTQEDSSAQLFSTSLTARIKVATQGGKVA